MLSSEGFADVLVVARDVAISSVFAECELSPPVAFHAVVVRPSMISFVIPFVSIFEMSDVCHVEPFQYFHVALLSKETRYLIFVLVGVFWVVVMFVMVHPYL